jgi:hypothetical protein
LKAQGVKTAWGVKQVEEPGADFWPGGQGVQAREAGRKPSLEYCPAWQMHVPLGEARHCTQLVGSVTKLPHPGSLSFKHVGDMIKKVPVA